MTSANELILDEADEPIDWDQRARVFVFCVVLAFLFVAPFLLPGVLISGTTLFAKIDQWRYQPSSDFVSSEWKSGDLKYRYSVAREVINRQVIVGMTEAEVISKLGDPEARTVEGWQYEIRQPGSGFMEFYQDGGVLVRFKDRKVTGSEWNLRLD